jgi:thiazolylpeptide-type bacteriocin precursor
MSELANELRLLASETFEIEDIADLDVSMTDACSSSTSTSSCSSCSTSSCCSCTSSSCSSTS